MADFNSKYTGEEVEALLDIVSQGGSGGGEVQKTTEAEILAMGFTKNQGTITEVKMNGESKGTSGVVDLGTVITAHQDISGKANTKDLAVVATSGSYNDLSDKPTIPTTLSQLTQSASYRTVTDTEKSTWGSKQDKLVSGTNLKTINGESLLGSGDIAISSGGSSSKEVAEAPVEMMGGPLMINFANAPMQPNKVYVASSKINGIYNLSIATPTENHAEYMLIFSTDSIIETFAFPDNIRWANGVVPTIEINACYELSIAATKMNGEYVYKAVLTKF